MNGQKRPKSTFLDRKDLKYHVLAQNRPKIDDSKKKEEGKEKREKRRKKEFKEV